MSTPNNKTCTNCGKVVRMNEKFCGKCGHPLNSSAVHNPSASPGVSLPIQSTLPPQPTKSRQKKIKMKHVITIITTLITAAAVIIGALIEIAPQLPQLVKSVTQHTPTVTPTPIPTNLIKDGGFDNGIIPCTSKSWHIGITQWCTTDPQHIVIDKNNNGEGATPATSVKLESNTIGGKNTYLFAPSVQVAYGKIYEITYYLKLIRIKKGTVFVPYIDEYDIQGTDVTVGGYRKDAERSSPTVETVTMIFKPSSQPVTFARLYFIVVGNSDTLAYVDNVTWKETN